MDVQQAKRLFVQCKLRVITNAPHILQGVPSFDVSLHQCATAQSHKHMHITRAHAGPIALRPPSTIEFNQWANGWKNIPSIYPPSSVIGVECTSKFTHTVPAPLSASQGDQKYVEKLTELDKFASIPAVTITDPTSMSSRVTNLGSQACIYGSGKLCPKNSMPYIKTRKTNQPAHSNK
jgi:hypothetical protein